MVAGIRRALENREMRRYLIAFLIVVLGALAGVARAGDSVCSQIATRAVEARHTRQMLIRIHNGDRAALSIATPEEAFTVLNRVIQDEAKIKALTEAEGRYAKMVPPQCRSGVQARLEAAAAADPEVRIYDGPAPGPPVRRCSDGRFSDHCGG